ncbi:MAG: DUF2304 domain-containing protein [Coriobacteriales bacterium]|nr:DUF2304 domain-containing protein [Coriobacteriales bacterium]
MSLVLRILLIVAAIATCIWICYKIRKSKVKMGHAIFWIVFSIILIIFAIFPQIAELLASLFGFISASNFIFLFVICALLFKLFTLSIEVSQLGDKVATLSQEIAIRYQDNKNRIANLEDANLASQDTSNITNSNDSQHKSTNSDFPAEEDSNI